MLASIYCMKETFYSYHNLDGDVSPLLADVVPSLTFYYSERNQ